MANGTNENNNVDISIAGSAYAQRTRQLIKLITELRGVGAQADIDLPRIAVIGNQSAGKSSLVEAISGITVPRASGTCTRCPMECRLRNTAGPWKCQVWLRFERDENGQRRREVQEIPFGPPVADKSKLEELLRRAQMAVLNPKIEHTDFLDLDLSTVVPGQPPIGYEKPLQFSMNVVALDLCGPNLADLSFIDLPGIISNVAEGEDRRNIQLVQNMVKEHIQGNALILLTLTMRDDLENQSAAFLAKEADPKGVRTIGVLTKADTILRGEEATWVDVLEGRRHALARGYFVTKQPGPDELKDELSFEEAREREKVFFATTEPWRSCSDRMRSRIGVLNLTQELSGLLSKVILQALPKLREDARCAQKITSNALAALPPPLPSNPVTELLRLLNGFATAAQHWIDGTEEHERLVQAYNAAAVEFSYNILQTAPNFRPFKNSDEEEDSEWEFEYPEEDATLDVRQVNEASSPPGIFLSDVRGHIRSSLGRELPFNVPYSAKRSLIEKCFNTWKDHALVFFEVVLQATSKHLHDEIEKSFGRFAMTPLHDSVRIVVDKRVEALSKRTRKRINWFLEMEYSPFTQNHNDLSSSRDTYLARYKAARRGLSKWEGSRVSVVIRDLASLGLTGLTADDLVKLTKSDDYEEEFIVMAEVRAYWHVAYKRIIDDIPRTINQDFLLELRKSLPSTLTEEFGIGRDDAREQAKVYLAEDPNDVVMRDDLTAKQQRLDEVLKKLCNFGHMQS